MWKFVLALDVLILALLWMLAMVAITPAHNLLVLYAEEGGVALPLLTDYAIQVRSLTGLVPLAWAIFSIFFWKWLGKQSDTRRTEGLITHGAVSLLLGFTLLFFFMLAGILPILKIGASIG